MPWTEKLERSSPQILINEDASGRQLTSFRINVVLVIYLGALALAILDNAVQSLRVNLLFIALGALAALDWRGARDAYARLVFIVPTFVLSVVLGLLLCFIAPQPVSAGKALQALAKNEAYLIWPISLWLYAPLLKLIGRDGRLFERNSTTSLLFAAATATLLLCAWDFATSFSSLHPMLSFRDFQREIGITIPFLLFWIGHAPANPILQRQLKFWALPVLAIAVTAAFALGIAYSFGSEELRAQIEDMHVARKPVILKEPTADRTHETRLQYPFGHHNRMGYFSMLCVVTFSGAAWIRAGGEKRRRVPVVIALTILSLMAFYNMALTLNRGAALATVGGILIACLWVYGRRGTPLLLLPLILLLAMPSAYRDRVFAVFQAKTYQDTESSAGTRIKHFAAAARTITRFPLLGVGYGWHNYEKYYRDVLLPELDRKDTEALHAHNIWLEQTAETGIPGGILLFPCVVAPYLIYAGFARCTRDREAKATACLWVGLGFAMNIYGLVNHPLRESVGLISWGIIAAAMAEYVIVRSHSQSDVNVPAPQ